MGQGGSLSQNKSLILSNWTQTSIGSNIIFNKVTNQQIQRHQLVINDKNRLLSYAKRMQDQSGLICRLIYFHPKTSPNQDKLKSKYTKINNTENANNNRPKSMISQTVSGNQVQSSSATSIPAQQQINQPKIYCIYTDRMIPIKEWNKDKIIDVITAFKKLTKLYGKFKVRQHCICENQRKEVKVWINQNPVSNFPVQSVETEEDMIADFAAILVSKKEKIAKQLLDIQFFDEAIDHFSNLTEYDHKKYFSSGSSSNTASYRQSNVPIPSKQTNSQNPFFQHSPQVKNFYNLYVKGDNTYTVNSTTDNSKFKIMAQANFGISRQSSIPNFMQIKTPNHFQTPEFCSLPKDPKNSNQCQVLIKSQIKSSFASPKSIDYPDFKKDLHNLLDNTSIMIHGDQSGTKSNTNFLKTQKNYTDFNKVTQESMNQMQKIRKKEPNANFNLFQNPKVPKTSPKFISSTTQDINNRPKNNTSCDIRLKKPFQGQQGMLDNKSLIYTQKKQIENASSINYDKDYFSSEAKPSSNQNLHKTQTASIYHQQKTIEQGRFSECQKLRNYQQQNREFNKNITQDNLSTTFVFVKSGLENDKNKMHPNFETNKKGVMQIETSSNMTSSNPVKGSQNKKSFPKYFHDKKMAKSIQKTNEKTIDQKSKNLIMKTQYEKSPRKQEKSFGQQKFEYRRRSNKKSTIHSLASEVIESQLITKQIISSSKPSNMNDNLMRVIEDYEPRRKFTSTMEYNKSKKILNNKEFQENELKKHRFGEPIESTPCYTQSWEVTRENFMNVSESGSDQTKFLKTSNNVCEHKKDQKSRIKGFSYFKSGNANDLTFGSNKQQCENQKKGFESEIKKRTKFQSIDNTEEQRFKSQPDEIKEIETPKRQQSKVHFQPLDSFQDEGMNQQEHEHEITENIDESNRKMTFPNYYQGSQNPRKNDKQFTFFNPSQKLSGMQVGQNYSFEQQPYQKNRVNVYKKVSFNNQDEKQTLPRTTADEREKRIFKETRQSQILIDINDLHSSDPGHRIQQIVEIIEKQKQKKMMNNDNLFTIQQKIDIKENPIVKRWEPSVNIYTSWVKNSAQQNSSAIKKKNQRQQKNKANQDPQIFNQIEQQNNHENEGSSRMSSSQNLQSKKKIRKEVLMDYKGLFDDEPPRQKQETAFEKERARKLQLKKIREQEEKLLENTSSKDLLIQEKVQKQKQKHAQLKNDLSKLFSDEF